MNDKMREEFEAAYSAGVIYMLERTSNIQFEDIHKQRAWAAWQASRAALVIELPESYPRHRDSYIDVMDAELVVEAIEEAGVRVRT